MSRRACAVLKHLLLPLCLGVAGPAFAVLPTGVMLKAPPNQTTTFAPGAFVQSPVALTPSSDSATGLGVNNPYSTKNGTVTICGQDVSYTPAFGFTGTDSFNVTVTNSSGSVSSAVANVIVQYVPTLAMQPDHTVRLQLPAAAGTNYTIQASTDMKTWTALGTVASSNGVVLFTDTNAASFPTRYYRLAP